MRIDDFAQRLTLLASGRRQRAVVLAVRLRMSERSRFFGSLLVLGMLIALASTQSTQAAPAGFRLPIHTGTARITWGPGQGDHTGTAGSEALDFGQDANGPIAGRSVYPVLGGRATAHYCGLPSPCNVFFNPSSPHAFGNYVDVDHSDSSCGSAAPYRSRYAHLDTIAAGISGTCVSQGTAIGTVGNTGNSDGAHLHLQLTRTADGSGVRILDAWGMLGDPDWARNRGGYRGFVSTEREQLYAEAYNRNGGSGTLGGPRADLTISNSPLNSSLPNCPPQCEGVPHFWANEKRLLGARGNIVTQNLNGPDNQVGGSDDSIIALYEVYSGSLPAAVPVYWRDGSGERGPDRRAFVVRGGIWNVYAGAGGPNGRSQMSSPQDTYSNTCGFPISDEMAIVQNGVTKRISYFSASPESRNSSPNWILWDPSKGRIFSNCVPRYGPDPDAYPLPGPAPRSSLSASSTVSAGVLATEPPPGSGSGSNWATNPPAVNWHAEFFRDTSLSSRCADWWETASYVLKDWGEGSPDGACPSDNWSARYTGTVHLSAGSYRFGLHADDWGRIRLNGNIVVNKWPPNDQHYESYVLSEGDYTISAEFADTAGTGRIVAWWWKEPDMPREVQDPSKWFVQYYAVRDPSWWDPIVSFNEATNGEAWWRNWDTASPGWGLPGDRISARVQKTAIFNPGTTMFHIRVDDGGRLWVDDNLIIDRWILQGPTQYDAALNLSAGLHRVRFEFFEEGGGATAQVWWDSPSPTNDAIAAATLIPSSSANFLQSTVAATTESAEPTSTTCGSIGKTVWYSLVPSVRSQVEVTTAGSDFGGAIGVYTGAGLGALTEIACNGGGSSSGDARVVYTADPGKTYWLQIGGASDAAGQLTLGVTATQRPPLPPTGLSVSSLAGTSVDLTWQDLSSDEDGFTVQRRVGGAGEWATAGTVPHNATSFRDAGLTPGTTYQYQVRAFNPGGESLPTEPVNATTQVQSQADLSVLISGVPMVARGQAVTYLITVSDAGPSTVDKVVLTDVLPVDVRFRSLSSPSEWTSCVTPAVGSSGTITCSNPAIFAGASSTLTVVADVPLTASVGASVANTVTVTSTASTTVDPDTANNSSTTAFTVTDLADLSATITATSPQVLPGQNATYTIGVSNLGPGTATGTLTVRVPLSTTFQSMTTPNGWTCDLPPVGAAGGTGVLCYSSPIAPALSATFTQTVKVDAAAAPGTVIFNAASIESAFFDPNLTNNQSSVNVTVASAAAPIAFRTATSAETVARTLTITTPTGTQSGDVIIAAVYWDNSVANAVTAPAGFTLVRQDSGAASQGVSLYYHVVSGAEPASYTWSATASRGFAGVLAAYSGVDTRNPIDGVAGLGGTSSTPTAPSITTTTGGDVLVGVWSTWNSRLTLAPPAGMTARRTLVGNMPLMLSDKPLPSAGTTGTQIASSSATTGFWTGQTLALRGGGGSGLVQADLAVSHAPLTGPFAAGQDISIGLSVNNNGTAQADSVRLTDTLPTNLTFRGVDAPGWSCTNPAIGTSGTITCTRASLAAGQTANITVFVHIDGNVPTGTVLTNSAAVSSATADPATANNSSSTSIQVQNGPSADMRVSMVVDTAAPAAGQTMIYHIEAGNAGPSTAPTATLTDTLPANTTFQYLDPTPDTGWVCTTPARGSTGTVRCTWSGMPAQSWTDGFYIGVQVDPSIAPGTAINNTVTISGGTADPNAANNSATVTVTVPQQTADVRVTSSAASPTVRPGDSLTFNITVTNGGPATAVNVTLSDTVPGNTTFRSFSAPTGWSCLSPSPDTTGTISCTGASLASAASASFALTVNVSASASNGASIANTVTVSSASNDPNPSNNSSTATATVTTGTTPATPVFRTASSLETSGTTLTITRPTGVQLNDVLLAAVYWDSSAPNSVTPPAGFTLIRQDGRSTNQSVSLYYHVVTGSDPGSYTWSATRASDISGIVVAYSGVDTANPVDVAGGQIGTTTDMTAPSVTTTSTGDMLVGVWSSWASRRTISPPAGMTARRLLSGNEPVLVADKLVTAAGATGSQSATASASPTFWTGQVVALRGAR